MKKTKKKASPSKKDVVRTSKVHPDSIGLCGAAVDGMSNETCKVNIGAHINIGASVGVAPAKHIGASSIVGEKEGKLDEEEDADDDEDVDGEDDDDEDDEEVEEGGEDEDNTGKDLRVKSTKNSPKIAGLTNIDVRR